MSTVRQYGSIAFQLTLPGSGKRNARGPSFFASLDLPMASPMRSTANRWPLMKRPKIVGPLTDLEIDEENSVEVGRGLSAQPLACVVGLAKGPTSTNRAYRVPLCGSPTGSTSRHTSGHLRHTLIPGFPHSASFGAAMRLYSHTSQTTLPQGPLT